MSYEWGTQLKRELDDCIETLYFDAYCSETLSPDEAKLAAIKADILSGILWDLQAIEMGVY